jgi:hypothetical protein
MALVMSKSIGRASVPAHPASPAPPSAPPSPAPSPALSPVPAPTGPAAAAVTSGPAQVRYIFLAFLFVVAGSAGAFAMWNSGRSPQAIHLTDATTVFAGLFAYATAVERLLEPFARWFPGAGTKAALEHAVAEMSNLGAAVTPDALTRVAAAKSAMERGQANRGIMMWGVATGLATFGSSAGGFYLLHAIAGPQWNGIETWIDAIVTGLVVGSGTKPLHDVISRVQSIKEKGSDPTS